MFHAHGHLATRQFRESRFTTSVARQPDEIAQCLRLRQEVFSREWRMPGAMPVQVDKDHFDDYCKHLMVIDNASGEVVATSRLLVDTDIIHTGCFYAETEFEISRVIDMPGKFMEIGHTCVHPDYRKGSVLALLWQGVARIVALGRINSLIGCIGIPLSHGEQYINSLMHILRNQHYAPAAQRVRPLTPLRTASTPISEDLILSIPLKAYLRQGAVVCGEPALNETLAVANLFVFMDGKKIVSRYRRHFSGRVWD